jgi:membrane-associated phospholipid phosphatase
MSLTARSPRGDGRGTGSALFLPRRRTDLVQFAAAAIVLALTALPIDPRRVGGLEIAIFEAVNGLTGAVYWPVWVVMQCGQLLAVPVAAALALVARRFRLALELVLAGGSAYLLAKLVKEQVYRGRPGQLLEEVILRSAPPSGRGFVAGHAATAFALAVVAMPYLGKRARWLVVGIAGFVAIARVYVGAHLPLDIVGGAALGWMTASGVHLVLGAAPARRAT